MTDSTSTSAASTASTSIIIDVTLLRGLEPVMSTKEQARLTAMFTSGDPNELAVAAKILHDLGSLLKDGVLAHQRTEEHEEFVRNSFRSQIKPNERTAKNNRIAFNNR